MRGEFNKKLLKQYKEELHTQTEEWETHVGKWIWVWWSRDWKYEKENQGLTANRKRHYIIIEDMTENDKRKGGKEGETMKSVAS